MHMKMNTEIAAIMQERFGHDNLIALATVEGDMPSVRTVNAYYENGAFYVVTYAQSNKMRQMQNRPTVGLCGDWLTAHGIGESLGHILLPENAALAKRLRAAFAAWYNNGHTNENDPNTIILRIRLTDAVLFHHGTRYDIDFTA